MRYLPARVVPTSESGSVSSAIPSAGQRVVVSGYSTPHFGHFFIWLSLTHTPSATKRHKSTISYRACVPLCGFTPLTLGRRRLHNREHHQQRKQNQRLDQRETENHHRLNTSCSARITRSTLASRGANT